MHVDGRTEADAAEHGSATAYSTDIRIQGNGPKCPGTPAFCKTPATNPQLLIQVAGGSTVNNPNGYKHYFYPGAVLVDHWYDMVLHIVWSPTAAGYLQWWVDGEKVVDVRTPTLYVRSDGTWSFTDGLGVYNYRLWANWESSVDGDEFTWGPSAASVGFSAPGSDSQPLPPSSFAPPLTQTSVTINWTASPSPGVTSYNVYRSRTSGSGFINVATTSATQFTDNLVTAGQTYYYVVTALAPGDANPESVISQELTVVVP
jgi:hypothetical protein